jgi:hypothetical protein
MPPASFRLLYASQHHTRQVNRPGPVEGTINVTVDIYGHLLGEANQNAADAAAALVQRRGKPSSAAVP